MIRYGFAIVVAACCLSVGCMSRTAALRSQPGLAGAGYGHEYSGPERRYRLHLPGAWQPERFAIHERSATEVRALHTLARDWVALDYLPYARTSRQAMLAGIVSFRTADWVDLAAAQRSRFAEVIAQTPEYIFIATLPDATTTYPANSDDARLFTSMRMNLEQLKAAFSLPDGRSPATHPHLATTGTYEAMIPGQGGSKWRKISVTLRADGSALLGEENLAATVLDLGQWCQTDDLVLLQPLSRSGRSMGMPLVWTVQPTRLVPVAWDRERYGSFGLLMQKKELLAKPVGLSKN